MALRVTDDTNTASLTSIANALQWVINNHSQYNITSVNMSLSDGGNYAQNWFANDGGAGQQVTELIGQLTAMNIPVIAATGNSFTGQQGEGFSAIVAGTISVTATDLSGNLLSNAQRLGTAIGGASATTIAAPGEGLTAPSGDSGTATVEGTSFATALVTGGVTLLQEIYQSRFGTLPTVAQIKTWIQQSATPIHDPVTGITLGELNLHGGRGPDSQWEPSRRLHRSSSFRFTSSSTAAPAVTATPATSTAVTTTSSSGDFTCVQRLAAVDQYNDDDRDTATNVQVYINGQRVVTEQTQLRPASKQPESSCRTLEELFASRELWGMPAARAGGDPGPDLERIVSRRPRFADCNLSAAHE